MADETLTQEELEALLNTMASGAASGAALDSMSSSAFASRQALSQGRPRERIVPYDFKRPERVGKEQMRALQTLHEGFSRNFGAALSAMLRSIVEVKLTSVDQLTYSEFVYSLENPTCFNLLRAAPLDSNLILDINPSILYPIIDRLLGGGRDPGPVTRRPLTEIELRLVSRITSLFLQELHKAWQHVIELELSVERVESNPQLVQIVPPNEVVVLLSFELTLGDLRGILNLCIPFNSLEQISSKLSSNTWATYGRRQATPETIEQVSRHLRQSVVELVVPLAETRISTGDMLNLRVGDIITTEKDVQSPVEICMEGVAKFRAHLGAFKGQKAVQVDAPIAEGPAKK